MTATISRERLFAEWLSHRAAAPFDWASANCCHFAAAWVAHAEQADPMAGLPATATATAAQRLVKRLGGMMAAWTRQLGRDPIPPLMAQVGDVVLVPQEAEQGVGAVMAVCNGAVWMAPDAHGAMIFGPMSAATAAWRVEPRA
jgi:hypothetical protein